MNRLAIELNDAGLLVADSQQVLASEPGYAIVDNSHVITGSAAYAQARLMPSRARSGFWSALSVAGAGAESQAELAYEHLKMVWSKADRQASPAVLLVPGFYDNEQLGLVLGIAHECGITVEAMVDSAIAASALQYEGAQLLHIDASLRTVSAARIDQAGAAAVDARETSETTGLSEFNDEMARAIARIFVRETRVDPLHQAATEQQVYDGLPGWLQSLHRSGTANAEIRHSDDVVSVELTTEKVRSASLRLFREIARLIAELRTPGATAVVQLTHRLAALPGLLTELARIEGVTLSALDANFPATSALQRTEAAGAGAEEVRFVRRLPFAGDGEVPAAAEMTQSVELPSVVKPTHIVYEGIAYRLGSDGVEISGSTSAESLNGVPAIAVGARGGSVSAAHCKLSFIDDELEVRRVGAAALRVNDESVESRRRLEIGDVVRVGQPAAELHIVALEE